MNKLILTLTVLLVIATQVFSQAPQSFKYQAVVRDGAGTVLSNQMVSFQLSILEGSETGNSVYTETFTTTTNSYGLVNLIVGNGNIVNGDFTSINWGGNGHFLKVELDETGGTTYAHIGTSMLNSVPYALNAKTAETAGNVFSGDYTDLSNTPDLSNYDTDATDDFDGDYNSLSNQPTLIGDVTGDIDNNTVEKIQGKDVSITTPSSGQVLKWNGTEWAPADDDVTGGSGVDGVVNSASFSGTSDKVLTLGRSNGLTPLTANFTDEVDDADNDATNELITSATLNGTNLEITDAGGTNTVDLSSLDNSTMNVNDADADATNEIQVLSISNDTIYLSDGGYVKLPTGFDGDYNSLSNQPIIPTSTSDLTNDSGFITNADDADADATNELNTSAVLNGTDLQITDAGGTKTVDLSSLDNAGTDSQTLSVSGTSLSITGGNTVILQDNINDADADATNELITNAVLSGTNLQITDAGGTNTVDLSSLDNAGTDSQTLSVSGTSLSITGGNTVILQDNVDDADANATNELITNAVLSGTDLQITDAGGTNTVDLSSLVGTDSQTLSVVGHNLSITGGNTITLPDDVDDADHDIYNELQVLNFSNDTLYLSDGGQVYMGAYGNLWEAHGDDIYNTNTRNVGVGLENPEGKLVVQGDSAVSDTLPLFEVKNKDGITVFAVYDGGIRMYVNDDPAKANNDKSGFAIGGYRLDKSITNEYMRVTPDSVRIYIKEENTNKDNNKKGGFAIGGYRLDKTTPDDYLNIYAADTVFVIDTTAQMLWYPLKEAFLSGKVLVEHADSVGQNSWATGYVSKSIGDYSQALGYQARAFGDGSTAIGHYANAITDRSYAIGDSAIAKGIGSFAIGSIGRDVSGNPTGQSTLADGEYSMAIGMGAHSSGKSSLSAGSNCLASGDYAISFGYADTASGDYSSAFGRLAVASGDYSFATGFSAVASGNSAYSFGRNSNSSAYYSYAMGYNAIATRNYSYAIGASALAEGFRSYAIGSAAEAHNTSSIAIGTNSDANGNYSLAMGNAASTTAEYATAIGYNSSASGDYSLAAGRDAVASNQSAFAFGYEADAGGANSFAIGRSANASATGSYALGYSATASDIYATAIGFESQASADYSFAVGYRATSSANNAVAIGHDAIANGLDAIAIGRGADATFNGVAIGLGTDAGSGLLGTALGAGSKATGAYSVAVGGGYSTGGGAKTIGLITASGDYAFGIALESGIINTDVAQANTMAIMGGRVGINTTTPGFALTVSTDATGYVAMFNNNSTSNQMLRFTRNNSFVGNITESGGTVSYNAFTGSHYAVSNDDLYEGILVSVSDVAFKMLGDSGEAVYDVHMTIKENDSKVMGSFIHSVAGEDNHSDKEFKLISAVGNGTMWVIDNGENLQVGDYLISSNINGNATKENGKYDIAHIVGRVAENVDWNNVTKTINGKKHKLVSVFYETFDKDNRAEKLSLEVEELRLKLNEIDNLKAELQEIKNLLDLNTSK